MATVRSELGEISAEVKRAYERERRLLSFDEYLEVFQEAPAASLRDAATYLRDMIDFYGTEQVPRPWGTETRYRVFDQGFLVDEDDRREALVGQEEVQEE